MQAVASTMVSPYFNITEPCACSAKSEKIAVKVFSPISKLYSFFFINLVYLELCREEVRVQTTVLFQDNETLLCVWKRTSLTGKVLPHPSTGGEGCKPAHCLARYLIQCAQGA